MEAIGISYKNEDKELIIGVAFEEFVEKWDAIKEAGEKYSLEITDFNGREIAIDPEFVYRVERITQRDLEKMEKAPRESKDE